ncbi:hypothetical protein ULG90_17740 [Halopseudomonas pachastrellae]|nr:hypothetical protein ULG90_17740 [Halopseudomonas pachastrellae]
MSKVSSATAPVWSARLTRILLAVVGGYALTYCATAALARLLPFERIDAAISATLLSFALYTPATCSGCTPCRCVAAC